MSLTNPNKVVTEERLAEFYGQLLPYLGGMPEAVVNKFSKSDLYSTTEKIVGCWTDGKPIYQKTFTDTLPNCTTDGTESTKNISIGASIDKIVGYSGFVTHSSNSIIPITTYRYSDSKNQYTRVQFFNNSASSNANSISLRNAYGSYNGASVIITIQYTKTTDAANSFKFSTETDYSTTEKIVGTWIDGKPLYQKTISTGTLPKNTTSTVATNIANIKRVINISGYGYTTSGRCIHLPFAIGGPIILNVDIRNISSTGANIILNSSGDMSAFTESYVTLQYTKTTD